jgi:hypothetical protein
LTAVTSLRSEWESDRENCGRILGDAWRGEKSDFGKLVAIAEWCERLSKAPISVRSDKAVALAANAERLAAMLKALREAAQTARSALQAIVKLLDLDLASFGDRGLEHTDLDAVAVRFGAMAAATDRYASWTQLARRRQVLVSAGLSRLEERMRSGEIDGADAAIELRDARAERLWKIALEQNPNLRGIGVERRHDLVDTFATLERQQLRDNVTTILAGHLAQVPQGAMGEMKVLRGEIGKKRGRMALRRLVERAGTAIQRIKPVLLMSPISVAQYLAPGTVSFDLLVIDEASQVRPSVQHPSPSLGCG